MSVVSLVWLREVSGRKVRLARVSVCVSWAFWFGLAGTGPASGAGVDGGGDTPSLCACASVDGVLAAESVGILDSVLNSETFVPPKAIKVEKSGRMEKKQRAGRGLRVLILGDSLALCGFGKTLDSKIRTLPQVEAVATFMACGSVPTSWLASGALANARTACGFWSIEGSKGEAIKEVRDTFGMEKGHRPASYPVPKLERLAEAFKPDVLVMQSGTNLLSLFSDGRAIFPERHGSQIRSYMNPFVQHLVERTPSLKKVYWIAPPVSERVTKEVQDFLFRRMETFASPLIEFVDSRTLILPPYKNLMPDREHFIGRDMDLWADKVFKLVQADVADTAFANREGRRPVSVPPSQSVVERKGPVGTAEHAVLSVRARLLSKSRPLSLDQIHPYHESMVGHLYKVEQVLGGAYAAKELVVMHPAHIGQKPEPLEKWAVGQVYSLDLVEFEGSRWESIKRSEQTGRPELLPFIRKEDEARFPSGNR